MPIATEAPADIDILQKEELGAGRYTTIQSLMHTKLMIRNKEFGCRNQRLGREHGTFAEGNGAGSYSFGIVMVLSSNVQVLTWC